MITTHALSILVLALAIAFLILLASHVIDALEAACAAVPAAAAE